MLMIIHYVIGDRVIPVTESVKEVSNELFCWFINNQIKANPDNCHLKTSNSDEVTICFENYNIKRSKCENLLGIDIDCILSFNDHIDRKCKKPGQKLNALSEVTTYMNLLKRRMLLNTFILIQFSYCPLVWMFHSRGRNIKINRLHERRFRIIHSDEKSTFIESLEKDNSVSTHK